MSKENEIRHYRSLSKQWPRSIARALMRIKPYGSTAPVCPLCDGEGEVNCVGDRMVPCECEAHLDRVDADDGCLES